MQPMKPAFPLPAMLPTSGVYLALTACALASVGPAFAAMITLRGHEFTVPDGFTVEEVATTNLVPRPVSASFDDQGRLYVTDSSGSNVAPAEQLKNPTHRLLRLEDTDGDGRFDRAVVFADKVMFPQGCLWHGGSVYVAGPPSIWKFTDTDGDGVADRREEWFKGGTLTGCANDIHGPYLGPDGYIYWTKGAFAEQKHTLGNGRIWNDRAAHILRAKPDGSGLDIIMTGGMDNPVEVAFTADGETMFTSTFIDFSQPGFRDGVGHASYGAVFGKENDVLDDVRVPRTGPDLTHPIVQFGAGAASGLCRYQSTVLGAGFQDNLFASTFNLHKITRHQLRPSGATYASTDSDFLVSANPDFHPTDVLEDADGSLLVVDTGGWYKLCCPSSQLAKADVLGGIYRVRRTDAPRLSPAQRRPGYARLTQPPAVREGSALAKLKQAALKAAPESDRQFREALQQAAAHAAQDAESAHRMRVAAEGLGRLGAADGATDLFAALGVAGDGDEILFRSVAHALIQLGNTSAARAQLSSGASPAALRAALVVLDQVPSGNIQPADVLPHLGSGHATLRATAIWIAGRHADWGSALAGGFRERLAKNSPNDSERAELQSQLTRFARAAAVQEILASIAHGGPDIAAGSRLTALRAMAGASLKETPATWIDALVAALQPGEPAVQRQAVSTARALSAAKTRSGDLASSLERIGRNGSQPTETRLEALAAIPGGLANVDEPILTLWLGNAAASQPVAVRSLAVAGLTKALLTEAQLRQIADATKTMGPLELPKVVAAFEHCSSEAVGLALLNGLQQSKGLSGLRPETLRPRLTNFPDSVRTKAEPLLASLNADAAKQAARLESLLAEISGHGDIRRGQAIFNSPRAACSSCHAIGYLGGHVGPDLTKISEVRSERDLLEAIVYPSASFVRSYEPLIVAMRDGEEVSGVLRKDGADEIVLATGPTTETRVPRSDIVEMRPGAVSVMPQGLDEQLSRQELADLLTFLKNTHWGAR